MATGRARSLAALALLVLAAPASGQAAERTPPPREGSYFRLSLHAARPNESPVIALASVSGSRFRIRESLFVDTAFAVDFHYAGGGLALLLGNPKVAFGWMGEVGPGLTLTAAGGLALPLTLLNANSPAATLAYRYATGMDGGWDPWLWAEDRLSLFAAGRIQASLPDGYVLAAA